jgi:hypothetical protein
MSDASKPLKRITLTYLPYGGFPQEHHFNDVTEDDLAFIAVALHARKRRAASGDPEVVRFYDAARRSQLAWYEARLQESFDEGAGWLKRLVPRRIRERILTLQMDYLQDATASWAVELGDLHAQVQDMSRKVNAMSRRRPAERTSRAGGGVGVRLMCSTGTCKVTTPLDQHLPEGWSRGESGMHCPEHSAPAAADDRLRKVS